MSWIKNTYNQVLKLSANKKKQRQFTWLLTFLIWFISLLNPYKSESLILFFIGLTPLALGFIYPSLFRPLLSVWLLLGKLMGEITSFLVLFIIYFFVFSPVTIINRLFKKKEQTSWIKRVNNEIDYKKLY